MSEAYASRRTRRSAPDPSPAGRFIVVLAVLLSAVVVLYVLAVTVVLPRLRINRVVVHADFEMDREALLAIAGLDGGAYFFSLDADETERALESHPPIRSATVEKEFPNSVVLTLDRRRPLIVALVGTDAGTTPALIDETGTVFATGQSAAGADVPVLSGVSFRGNVVGSQLPDSLVGLLESLYRMRVDTPEVFDLVSEVRVDAHRAGDFDLLVHFRGFRVPVRIGSTINGESCTYALMVLDVLDQQGISEMVEELDFRSGEVVYRMKEAEDAGE